MWRSEVVGGPGAPPRWRTGVEVALVLLASLVSGAFSPAGHATERSQDWGVAVLLLATVAVLAGSAALLVRHVHPFALALASALVPLVVPIGNTLALVSLATLVGRRRGPAVWWVAGVAAVTTTLVTVLDARATPNSASLMRTLMAPAGTAATATTPVGPLPVVVVVLLGLGASIGAGLVVRSLRLSREASDDASTEKQISARLGGEVARRAERERIAREVHDVMGHRLSIIALHAGALERLTTASPGADPRVGASAHLVRESAAAASEDLHSLLDLLREPAGTEPAPLPLTELPRIVADAVDAGQVISSSIFVEDADRADPALTRGVHRIVAEVLTNARTHAPGLPVTLSVIGSPAAGITVDATNPLPPGSSSAPQGTLRGLVGLAERVDLLGGRFDHGVDRAGTVFHVRAELPWRAAPRGTAGRAPGADARPSRGGGGRG